MAALAAFTALAAFAAGAAGSTRAVVTLVLLVNGVCRVLGDRFSAALVVRDHHDALAVGYFMAGVVDCAVLQSVHPAVRAALALGAELHAITVEDDDVGAPDIILTTLQGKELSIPNPQGGPVLF